MKDCWQNTIDGTWIDRGAGCLDVIKPGTGEKIAQQALADAGDVDRPVVAAHHVHLLGALSGLRPVEPGRMVQAMGRYLQDHIDDTAPILTQEQGKPLWEARIEIEGAARNSEYYGNQAETVEARSIPPDNSYFDFTTHEPFGVSAQIIPWNYPIETKARSLSAPLATGNACVIKTPELIPLSIARTVLAAEAVGLPAGTVNILCGLGHEAGSALSAHSQDNQIVFTESVPTGIANATAAAQNVVPWVLELGGKSAAIVHDYADLAVFENDVRWGIFFNTDQVCSAMSRVIVHDSIHDELVERIAGVAKSLSVKPGMEQPEFEPTMGAMVSDAQRDRALPMIADATAVGATIAAGGHRPNIPGAVLEPKTLTEVTPDMTFANEEVFGPVLSVLKFKSDAEAIEIANGTPYGPVGGVFTRDLDRATFVQAKSLSTNGTRAVWKHPSAAM